MEKLLKGEGIFRRYKIFKGFRILSGCLYCDGALVWKNETWFIDPRGMYVCFHCGRIYQSLNGKIRLWPYREYEHLTQKKEYRGEIIHKLHEIPFPKASSRIREGKNRVLAGRK